jgi:hypothetical protein
MLPRATIAPGVVLLAGLLAGSAAAVPFAAPSDGRAAAARIVGLGEAAAKSAIAGCVLEAAHNTQYPQQGYVYFFNCEGDEVARRVEFTDCITGSFCRTWYPRTATLSFWISASQCNGTYPYTTSSFDAQVAIYPVDPQNPHPETPRPADEPFTVSPIVTIPPLTRTSAAGSDALVSVDLPLYCDCLRAGPVFLVFRWIGIEPADDACGDAGCVGRLPGLVSTGLCETPGCTGPNDPADTHTPSATYFRNVPQGVTEWIEAGDLGIRSDIKMSMDLVCCDAINVKRSTWGRIKSLQSR